MSEYKVGDVVRIPEHGQIQLVYKSQSTKGDFRARFLEGTQKGMCIWAHSILPQAKLVQFVKHGEAPTPYEPKVGEKIRVVGKCCDTERWAGYDAVITKTHFKTNYDHKIMMDIFDEHGNRVRMNYTACIYCTELAYPQMKLFKLSDLVEGDDDA